MTPATIITFLLLAAGFAFAVRRLVKKGSCDCGSACAGDCPSCTARRPG